MIAGVRNFKLKNATGAERDLTRPGYLLWQPQGLGWGVDVEVMTVGNTFVVTDEQEKRPNPSGTMVFKGYAEYTDFLEFVQVGGLSLGYRPLSTDNWRWLDCVLQIDKSEIDHTNQRLLCPVTFNATSHWYEIMQALTPQGEIDDNAMIYLDNEYHGYAYPYDYEDSNAGGIAINNGVLPSYFRLTFIGPVTNPVYTLYVNQKPVHRGRIVCNVLADHRLVIDTRPGHAEINDYNADGTLYIGRYGNSDFTTERFFQIPGGVSAMMVTAESSGQPNVVLEVFRRV